MGRFGDRVLVLVIAFLGALCRWAPRHLAGGCFSNRLLIIGCYGPCCLVPRIPPPKAAPPCRYGEGALPSPSQTSSLAQKAPIATTMPPPKSGPTLGHYGKGGPVQHGVAPRQPQQRRLRPDGAELVGAAPHLARGLLRKGGWGGGGGVGGPVWPLGRLVGCLVGWLVGRLVGWSVGWLVGELVGWLCGC